MNYYSYPFIRRTLICSNVIRRLEHSMASICTARLRHTLCITATASSHNAQDTHLLISSSYLTSMSPRLCLEDCSSSGSETQYYLSISLPSKTKTIGTISFSHKLSLISSMILNDETLFSITDKRTHFTKMNGL